MSLATFDGICSYCQNFEPTLSIFNGCKWIVQTRVTLKTLQFQCSFLYAVNMGESITLQLTSCLTGLNLTKQIKLLFIKNKQIS